jgi:hypothetical protein
MKIKNSFINAIINKDLDERLVPNGQLIDGENINTGITSSLNGGIISNVLGNKKMTNLGIVNGITIGSIAHPSKNTAYFFVKGSLFDYVIEWNKTANTIIIILQSTATTGILNFNVNYKINFANIIIGSDNQELLSWTDNLNPLRLVNIAIAKTYSIDGFSDREISLMKPSPVSRPSITPTVSVNQADANFMKDKFLSFAYRYKYQDGFYSAPSSWSKYIFKPSAFDLDYESFVNDGMINIYNAVDISFNTGSLDIIGIDLLFKESGSTDINVIEKFNKEEEGWGDNVTQSIEFNNSKIYAKLAEKEYYRTFDNVPLTAETQDFIGSRLAYANYVEGRDMTDINGDKILFDYTLSTESTDVLTTPIPFTVNSSSYSISGSPVTKLKTMFQIDFTGFSFVKGKVILVNFDLNTVSIVDPAPIDYAPYNFFSSYVYILDKDYTDFTDFYTNSQFKSELEGNFSDFFDATIPIEVGETSRVSTGFLVSNPSSNKIDIQIPAFTLIISTETKYKYFIDVNTTVVRSEDNANESMKSNRSYEVCMVFEDEQGRLTTGFTSEENTVNIPIAKSITQNRIKVTIPTTQKTPSWAKRYRFGIKENKGTWEEVYCSTFYADGIYRWIKLEGESKNKVKEGDELIVKKDIVGVKETIITTKVLEIKLQDSDFILDNKDVNGNDLIETAGLYMRISPSNFVIDYGNDDFWYDKTDSRTYVERPVSYIDLGTTYDVSAPTVPIDLKLNKGAQVELIFDSYRSGRSDAYFKGNYVAQKEYANFQDYYNEYLSTKSFKANTGEIYNNVSVVRLSKTNDAIFDNPNFLINSNTTFPTDPNGKLYLRVEGIHPGNANNRRGFLSASVNIRKTDATIVFEKENKDLENQVFYLTPEKYTITGNAYQYTDHLLSDTFNCFVFGNGVESYKIKDAFLGKELFLDFTPTSVLLDEYKQIRRYADITYSDVFQPSTNVNGLNSFNLSLANFKDDIEKSWGAIKLIKHRDTNLLVIQEDKWSQVLYGKDLLYNANNSSNLAVSNDVLNTQVAYLGEYGISNNASNFDSYGFNCFATDTKRGVVLRLDSNGLDEISSKGMSDYFKTLFRENTIVECIGKYDSFNDEYFLSISYIDSSNVNKYVTWRYSDLQKGWLPRHNFSPEDMLRLNNDFISFKSGELYLHNDNNPNNYNTFYGNRTPSKFSFYFNESPSMRKNFRTLDIEGTNAWNAYFTTEFQKGYINSTDFLNKEGVYRAYIRGLDSGIDTATLSCQGIGNVDSKIGNTLTVIDTSMIMIGDVIYDLSMVLIGTVIDKTATTITLTDASLIDVNDYILSAKPQSIETSSLLGYYMKVDMELDLSTLTEVFSVSGELGQSFE